MKKCPSCRKRATDADRCACGYDLAAARAEMARLMAPAPGATVYPFATMKKLSPEGRRAVAQAMHRARQT